MPLSRVAGFALAAVIAAIAQPPGRRPPPRSAQPQQQLAPEDYARVEGVVINGQTGEPLRKVEVQLASHDGGRPEGDETSFSVTTLEDGKFAFAQLPPGRYAVGVRKNGFTRQGSGWTNAVTPQLPSVQIGRGQSITGMTIRMLPHGVITGRVLDEDGDPVQRIAVSAYRYTYQGGRKALSNISSGATNDLGEYRIYGLTPGTYYLSAVPFDAYMPQRRGKGETYAPTYYPGAESVEAATPVAVGPGTQAPNMDIRLRRARLYTIAGIVTDAATGKPANRASVQVIALGAQGDSSSGNRGGGAMVREGQFNVRGLTPGAYLLRAQLQGGAAVGTTRVDIHSEDLTGVQITAQPNATLQGVVKYEGEAPTGVQSYVRISLEPFAQAWATGMAGGSTKDATGTFTIANVAAERYRVRLSGLPQGYYVKNILLGNQDIRATGLDFSAGAASAGELTITLASPAGSIEGSVKDAKDAPAANTTVVLIRREELAGLTDQIRTTTTGPQGEYQFANLAPGDYDILAFEEIEQGAWFDPEVRAQFQNQAKSVKVEKGSAAKQDLKAARP
jgi:uncharacterized protein (DUF2141 family)